MYMEQHLFSQSYFAMRKPSHKRISSFLTFIPPMQVLHCVMYPRAEYDLPIMSMDVVAKDGNISLGIIDPCPSRLDGSLPEDYSEMVE